MTDFEEYQVTLKEAGYTIVAHEQLRDLYSTIVEGVVTARRYIMIHGHRFNDDGELVVAPRELTGENKVFGGIEYVGSRSYSATYNFSVEDGSLLSKSTSIDEGQCNPEYYKE